MSAKTLAIIFGLAFVAVGLLGFISNPIVGEAEGAFFHADKTHNIVHIVSGILFLFFGLAMPGSARGFMILFGIIYLALGVMGFIQIGSEGMGELLGFLHVNGADNYLHIGLGAAILLAAVTAKKTF